MSPNEPTPLLDTLKTQLPPDWQPVVDELAAAMLPTDRPLRLSLLGAFSVGKSTLLNGLLGEPLLPAACEETTALPTFIEYGPERAMQLVGTDGSVLPLDDAGLARAATEAPEGAACAVVRLPLDWLRGVSIIDLPGLGGMSSRHREYTLAQVQQADVILYLIAPPRSRCRGPRHPAAGRALQ
jgi:ribosome biogenesis GTPase A